MSWAGVGVLFGFAALAMMSIGIFVLPIAIVAAIAAFHRLRAWPEIIGICAGPAFVLLWLAWRAWPMTRCVSHHDPDAVLSDSNSSVIQAGAELTFTGSLSCTSLNASALLFAGSVLVLAAPIAYRAWISRKY